MAQSKDQAGPSVPLKRDQAERPIILIIQQLTWWQFLLLVIGAALIWPIFFGILGFIFRRTLDDAHSPHSGKTSGVSGNNRSNSWMDHGD